MAPAHSHRKTKSQGQKMIDQQELGFLIDQGNIIDLLENPGEASSRFYENYQAACNSMSEWESKYKKALALAKLVPTTKGGDHAIEEKSFPFKGASLAMVPLVTEAMIDFNARTAPELVWAESIVRPKITGLRQKPPQPAQGQAPEQQQLAMMQNAQYEAAEQRAERIKDYTNYQLQEDMPNWRDEQDRLLMLLACVGTWYRKPCYNYDSQKVESESLAANEVKFNMSCKSFIEAPDKFINRCYTKNQVLGFIRGEQAWDIDESDITKDEARDEYEFIEGYTWFDLDGDGLKEPYCAIYDEMSMKIVALYADFEEEDIEVNNGAIVEIKRALEIIQYRFLPGIDNDCMGMGWGILFGLHLDAINVSLRQQVDAATLSNLSANTGIIGIDSTMGRGNNSVQSGPITLELGKLNQVPMRGNSLQVQQMPFGGPNQSSFNLMQYMIESSRNVMSTALIESNANEAAALYLAKLRQGMKIPNAIFARVCSAASKEQKAICKLNYRHADNEKYQRVLNVQADMAEDFNPVDCDIKIAANPANGSDIERIQRAETILARAEQQSAAGMQVINIREATINWLESMDTPDIESIAPEPDPNAVDPNMQIMAAQQQFEAELKQRDQALRENQQRLQEMKIAMETAKLMQEAGLADEETAAKIAKLHAETIQIFNDMDLARGNQAIALADQRLKLVQTQAEGGEIERQIQASQPGRS